MIKENIIDSLKTCLIIKNVNEIKYKKFRKRYYNVCFECELVVSENITVEIVLCIPHRWDQELIDIYLKNYTGKFIPHIESDGKICLFETEGILIDIDLIGIITQSLYRARNIILDGNSGRNKKDFIDEFELYWLQLPYVKSAKLVVPTDNCSILLKCYREHVPQKRKEKQVAYLQRKNNAILYVAEEADSLKSWNLNRASVVNAAFFVINPTKYIFPPDIREPVSIGYFKELLRYVFYQDIKKIWNKLGKEKIIFFRINQPDNSQNYLGFYLLNGFLQSCDESIEINGINQIKPISVRREDKEYLLMRTVDQSFSQYSTKILIIGCGSIGGHVINELSKAGFEDLTIVDDDILTEENIFRHVLGMEYILQYKSVAMENYIKKNIPRMLIKSLAEKIEDVVEDGSIALDEYDIVIAATGNHNVNRWLNRFVYKNEIDTPIIYAWNEVYGIGNHVAFFKRGNVGCFECLFGRDIDKNEIYDKSSYCAKGQKIVKSVGCGKSFVPYGNLISQKTTMIVLDMIKRIVDGEIENNYLVSVKGDDTYFKQMNLTTSTRYQKQKNILNELTGDLFANMKCGVCNDSM